MRALLCAALVLLWAQCTYGFFSPGSYREARQNYHEVMIHCEKEGGECLDVDFGTTDPPTTDPPTPAPTPAPRPTTRAPPPPVPMSVPFFWYPFWPFVPTTQPPRVPRPTTRAPRPTTLAPRPTTLAPKALPPKPVRVPAKPARQVKKAGKGKRRQKNQRNQGEQEIEVRKRRQAFNADPWDYLYNECTGGWEFDLGCGARGGNICCYSSNSGNNY